MSTENLVDTDDRNNQGSDHSIRSPRGMLLGHVMLGSVQLAVGIELVFLSVYCLLGRRCFGTPNDKDNVFQCYNLFEGPKNLSMCSGPYRAVVYDGFWSGPFFIAAGATGLAASRGGSKILCCIISCMVFSILATGVGFVALAFHVQSLSVNYGFANDTYCWLLLYVLAIVTATVQVGFLCGVSCFGSNHLAQNLQVQTSPALAVNGIGSSSSSYARGLPLKVMRSHKILGGIQIVIGIQLIFFAVYGLLSGDRSVGVRNFSGYLTAPFFIAAGATGVAGGRGRSRTLCCIISCLVLSILGACIGLSAIVCAIFVGRNPISQCYPYARFCFTFADIMWFLLYLLEILVAIVHAAFACRASCCCCLPGFSGPVEAILPVSVSNAARTDVGIGPADGQSGSSATDHRDPQPPPYCRIHVDVRSNEQVSNTREPGCQENKPESREEDGEVTAEDSEDREENPDVEARTRRANNILPPHSQQNETNDF